MTELEKVSQETMRFMRGKYGRKICGFHSAMVCVPVTLNPGKNARISTSFCLISTMTRLSSARFRCTAAALKSTLKDMRDGSGRDTEKDLYGKPGGYQTTLSSKTLAYPCRACGDGLKREAYLGGNIYFCPTCQPLERK